MLTLAFLTATAESLPLILPRHTLQDDFVTRHSCRCMSAFAKASGRAVLFPMLAACRSWPQSATTPTAFIKCSKRIHLLLQRLGGCRGVYDRFCTSWKSPFRTAAAMAANVCSNAGAISILAVLLCAVRPAALVCPSEAFRTESHWLRVPCSGPYFAEATSVSLLTYQRNSCNCLEARSLLDYPRTPHLHPQLICSDFRCSCIKLSRHSNS